MELKIEKEIEDMLMTWRDEEGLSTLFDNQLGIILQVLDYTSLYCKINEVKIMIMLNHMETVI